MNFMVLVKEMDRPGHSPSLSALLQRVEMD